MATATCPACGSPVPIPPGHAGEPVTCRNPVCGAVFEASAPVARGAAAALAAAMRPAARGPGRPELLDRLPTNPLLTPPPLLAAGTVVTLLYGLVLVSVVSSWKSRQPPPEPVRPQRETFVTFAPIPPPDANPPKAAGPSAKEKESAKGKAEKKAETKKKDRPKRKSNNTPKKESDPDAPTDESPPQLARADTSKPSAKKSAAPAPPPPPPEPPRLETWGQLVGAPWDCKFLADGAGLTMQIPGTLHILSPDLNFKNAPRLMTMAQGDFVMQVKVPGRILPGMTPIGKLPGTFQGAGLLMWQDENNYLRLEKASSHSKEGFRRVIFLELCRDNKVASTTPLPVREGDFTLKFDRRGKEVRCSYSPDDGKTWIEVKRQPVPFPEEVAVGISATNASAKPFRPRFEDFLLTGAGVKAKHGY